ncbi:MAG: transposase [Thermoproteota archaeon]
MKNEKEPNRVRNPNVASEPSGGRNPDPESEPSNPRNPDTGSEPSRIRNPSLVSEPLLKRNPLEISEPSNVRNPADGSEPTLGRNPKNASGGGGARGKIGILVGVYYDAQDLRIRTANRLRTVGITAGPSLLSLKNVEKSVKAEIKETLEAIDDPALLRVMEWLEGVKGIGPVLGAGLVSVFDPRRAQHASSFWRYAGLHVVDGEAPKRKRGTVTDWNPHAKVLAWKVATSFLKAKNPVYEPLYREAYFQESLKLNNPVENPENCPHYAECKARLKKANTPACRMHIHLRALRKTVKRFLADFWAEYRKAYGLPVDKPYILEKTGERE